MILRHEDLLFLACLFLGAYGGNFIDLIARFPIRRETAEAPGGELEDPRLPGLSPPKRSRPTPPPPLPSPVIY